MSISFSVLLSVYFKETPENLTECLESIFSQTLKADEVIIVLDGEVGTDLAEVINDWKKLLPIVLCRIATNVGLGNALNVGLGKCSNEIVFRMDTDDICTVKRFELQMDKFISNPNLSIIGGYVDEYEENLSRKTGCKTVPLDNSDIIKYMRYRNPFNHMTVAFKKSAIIAVGGYQHHKYMEDYNLWLRLLSHGYSGENLPDVLVHARAGNAMILRRRGLSYIKSEWLLAKLKRKLLQQTAFESIYVFFIRVVPRILPTSMTKIIYSLIRKK
ncbi:MAG: glycosyltransferase [Hafnia alvei]|uniref:glycosyltransferase n=1 Tax=Hafnia alvei TaxID=569 RepID=UPI0029116B7E|nr:glycosyltransferase [Hafnia alvei]MDU7483266.1 glycosyltransferase [Hafnia alvei]